MLFKSFLTVSGLTMLSRVAGFVRDVLTAAFLGAGALADAFVVAQRLPNLFRSLFAEGAFNAAFVPLFGAKLEREGEAAAKHYAAEIQSVLLSMLLPFVVPMIAGMPWVIKIIAPGFSDDVFRYTLAVSMGQVAFPYLLFISLTALQGGVLNSLGKLAPFATAPVIYNLVLIAALLLVKPMEWALAPTLSWSMTIAGLVQFLWLFWAMKRAGYILPLVRPRLTLDTKKFFRQLGPGVLGAGALQINLVVATMLASQLPAGAVAYLYYADRLNQLPLGVIGIALSTALLPMLARSVAGGNEVAAKHNACRGIEIALLFGLPAAAALFAIGTPIMAVLFARGEFTLNDAAASGEILAAYALGIPAFIVVKVLVTCFFARQDTKTPVRVALVAVAANVAAAIWFMQFWGAVGIAAATSLATWVNVLVLAVRLNQQYILPLDDKLKRRLPRMIFAALVMAVTVCALSLPLAPWLYEAAQMVEVLALGALVLAGGIVYVALLWLLGAVGRDDLLFLKRGTKSAEQIGE